MKQLAALFNAEYKALYNGEKRGDRNQVTRFDDMAANNAGFQAILKAFAEYRHDIITSDRECVAFMNVFDYIMAQ